MIRTNSEQLHLKFHITMITFDASDENVFENIVGKGDNAGPVNEVNLDKALTLYHTMPHFDAQKIYS